MFPANVNRNKYWKGKSIRFVDKTIFFVWWYFEIDTLFHSWYFVREICRLPVVSLHKPWVMPSNCASMNKLLNNQFYGFQRGFYAYVMPWKGARIAVQVSKVTLKPESVPCSRKTVIIHGMERSPMKYAKGSKGQIGHIHRNAAWP